MSTGRHDPKLEPGSPLALHLLGILCAHEGRYDEAEEAFLRAVEEEPEMAGSYVELGLVYACRGEHSKMNGALRQAVEVGPGGVRAYLGEHPLGDFTTPTARECDRPISATAEPVDASEDVPSLVTLAIAHLSESRDDEAVRVLERVHERGRPPAVVALLALARLLRE